VSWSINKAVGKTQEEVKAAVGEAAKDQKANFSMPASHEALIYKALDAIGEPRSDKVIVVTAWGHFGDVSGGNHNSLSITVQHARPDTAPPPPSPES
jgi:hypothetical protein